MNYDVPYKALNNINIGKIIYIIGTGTHGPINEPVYVDSIETVLNIFGEGSLTKSARSYFLSMEAGLGAYLIRTTGNYAVKDLIGDTDVALSLTATNGGIKGNDIRILYTADSIIITWPEDTTFRGIFKYDDYPTVSDLARAINTLIPDIIMASSIIDEYGTIELGLFNIDSNLENGFDGIEAPVSYGGKFKNYLYDCLISTLNILQGKYIDILCLADMYFDDIIPIAYDYQYAYNDANYIDDRDYLDVIEFDGTPIGYHKIAIEFCKQQSSLGIFTHCIMGFNKLEDNLENIEITIQADYDTVLKYRDGIQELNNDNGKYLSLCFGDLKYLPDADGEYIENWFITYAALWVSSGYNTSLTAVKLPSTVKIVQEFTDTALTRLIDFGLVTYKYSAYYGWSITAGITTALDPNPLKYTINHKVLQRIISQLNIDILTHISNSENTHITNKSISDIIDLSLNARKNEHIIFDYGFSLTYDKLSGNTVVNIDIYSVWSTEKITVSTNIYNSR